jgi:hypothetical protein
MAAKGGHSKAHKVCGLSAPTEKISSSISSQTYGKLLAAI